MGLMRALAGRLRTRPTLGRLALRLMPDMRRKIQIEPIGPFVIRWRRHRSYWLRDPLEHDGFMMAAFERLISPGETVYDIGANIGLYCRFLSSCFAAGQVVGFEPMRENTRLLQMNAKLDPAVAGRITLVPVALGEQDGPAQLQIDDISSQSAALDSVTHGQASEARKQYGLPPLTEEVMVRRLDSLLAEGQLPPPQLIKVDVEGAGGMVLAGSQETLRRHRPKVVMELHSENEGRRMWEILSETGYHIWGFVPRDGASKYDAVRRDDIREEGGICTMRNMVASSRLEDVCKALTLKACRPGRRVWNSQGPTARGG